MHRYLFCIFALFLNAFLVCAGPTSLLLSPRQAPPNTIYKQYPETETASLNFTLFVLPAPRALVQQIAGDFALLPFRGKLPRDVEATIGEDEHPLFVMAYYSVDVHYKTGPPLPQLSSVQTYASFLDCTRDGRTPCLRLYAGYFDELVPALSGNVVQASRLFPGRFEPPHSPYAPLAPGTGLYGLNVSDALLSPRHKPYSSAFTSSEADQESLDGQTVGRLFDAPLVRSYDSRCLKSTYFFNETTAPVRQLVGDVEVRSPLLPKKDASPQRIFAQNVLGIAAAVQRSVNVTAVDCSVYAGDASS
ncbi:hypothetical protein OC835_004170 [Tilletia horrida]|nr:hypothetical protein OC835_004170 [Tilletia horrida]